MSDYDKAGRYLVKRDAGGFFRWLLGNESVSFQAWAEAERRLTDERDRADVGLTTQVFATLAGRRPAWDQALRGWNMQTSPIFDEIRAMGREEGREKGREEGREQEARALLVRMGRRKFRKLPTKKQHATLDAMNDLARLEALAERLISVDSWAELLNGG